ncbi:MAG: glycosyltransferase [Clostridiales bacterium]|nr:glycosyltransferase [Clostridiales bacterium]
MFNDKYSVLMSVYQKENPNHLKESISSMLNQSIVPDEIVLVKDGPLTKDLDLALKEISSNSIINICSIKENVGLGRALNFGLENCRNELVVRMDTDDISMSDRCEKQLKIFNDNNDLSVLGTSIEEFIGTPENIVGYKYVKEDKSDIQKQIKFRNPMNHPSVMFRKSHVQNSGSYLEWFLNEDYYLWIRMIQNNYQFANINEPLVKMRVSSETYLRRGGYKYYKTQKKLFLYMLENKIINLNIYLYNNIIRFIARVMIPNWLRKLLYLKLLRRRN